MTMRAKPPDSPLLLKNHKPNCVPCHGCKPSPYAIAGAGATDDSVEGHCDRTCLITVT